MRRLKYEIFSHELRGKILALDLDLDGRKFEIEAKAAVNGEPKKIYELDIKTEDDGEGGSILKAYLDYKNIGESLDLSEVLMGCFVHHEQ
jgi:hypothetical protein